MSKQNKQHYRCQACGQITAKWAGQCQACQAWNTLEADTRATVVHAQSQQVSRQYIGYAGVVAQAEVLRLSEVKVQDFSRKKTQSKELDRVLGGGLMPGAVVLLGGDPGIGKSTLLLQMVCHMDKADRPLYVTGEESLEQVSERAKRLVSSDEQDIHVLAETQVDAILMAAEQLKPKLMVIDSIQTLYVTFMPSSPGSVAQVRESVAQLVQFAKKTNTTIFLVGHVTKDGSLAGPRVVEHMVDTVLYFEGEKTGRFRLIRGIKNRFGVNELGIFAMTEKGLKEVNNPSAIFLSRDTLATPGSVVMVTWEGSRPILVEVQALVDETHLANPRRLAVGFDPNRLAMLLAVLNRHGHVATHHLDVFLNIVGGVRITETAADLAVLLAVLSSLKHHVIPKSCIVFGEVGLGGEIRPVQSGQERLREACQHGFEKAIVPHANVMKASAKGLQPAMDMAVVGVHSLVEAIEAVLN